MESALRTRGALVGGVKFMDGMYFFSGRLDGGNMWKLVKPDVSRCLNGCLVVHSIGLLIKHGKLEGLDF